MGVEVQAFVNDELGNSAYLIIDRESRTAIAIDPARDVLRYVEAADSAGVEITWALETHIHNDFVSGARELGAARGARLGASGISELKYPNEFLKDGDFVETGAIRLQVIATPGHTPEHISYVLLDPAGKPSVLFSGGALMVGTAARTDLFGPALSWRYAHDLERSLKERILTLSDHVVVYPTHGGGSFCAVGAGSDRSTTIGAERATNRLVRSASSREFVTLSLDTGTYPSYYAHMRALNQLGARLLGLSLPTPSGLDISELDTWIARGAIAVDIRSASEYRRGHIPNTIAAGADGNLSGWLGWVLRPEQPIVLVSDPTEEGLALVGEAMVQLYRIGFDGVVGFLEGGTDAWTEAGRDLLSNPTSRAVELAGRLDADELLIVVDVREAAEWHSSHIPGSVNIPVHDIPKSSGELPFEVPLFVHCGHDYRATLGGSLLERSGYRNITILEDGWEGWLLQERQR